MRARVVIVALAAALIAALAARAGAGFGPPPAVLHSLERDWCSQSAYARAEHAKGVDRVTRRGLAFGAELVRRHPAGCAIGMRYAHARSEPYGTHAPWMRRGPHGDPCPRGALPLGRGATLAAERAAAAAEPRASLPVVVGVGDRARVGQLRRACGPIASRRSVVVSLSLNSLAWSASLSERVVAVAHFARHGWRVYQLLH